MATEDDLTNTEDLFRFLQGDVPDGYKIDDALIPRLTADQAWTVVWYLGEKHWQVTDAIERCGVCGELFDSESGGDCMDFGDPPYHVCDDCRYSEEAEEKRAKRPEGD